MDIGNEFAQHVDIHNGALATSAPLQRIQLDAMLYHLVEYLNTHPALQQQIYELRQQYTLHGGLGAAKTFTIILQTLKNTPKALSYFQTLVVNLLTEKRKINLTKIPPITTASYASYAKINGLEPTPQVPVSDVDKSELISLSEANHDITDKINLHLKAADSTRTKYSSVKRHKTQNPIIPTKTIEKADIHPIYTIPTQWEEPYRRSVEVINIHQADAKERVSALRYAGTPFILEGHENWFVPAKEWVLEENGEIKLNSSAFLHHLADLRVPVIEKNYKDTKPIKAHVQLNSFVKNYWEKKNSDYYLHQWQFPLNPKAAKYLCNKCEPLSVLGDNILCYWLDTVRGDNPLQYLFMGHSSTISRMHQDSGGLDITIAPILGTKRVTMLHKNAAKVDSVHTAVNFHSINLNENPLLAFVPAWQVDVSPGQILYMPEGTFHSCQNVTACLSYHRFHVDTVNLPGFYTSLMKQDAPTIDHAEILWNASHDIMKTLEENYAKNNKKLDQSSDILNKLDAIRALRHVIRGLCLEDAVPTNLDWDWTTLLQDVDITLLKIDPNAHKNIVPIPNKSVKTTKGTNAEESEGITPSNQQKTNCSTNLWDTLNLHVGDEIGVHKFDKRNRAIVKKIILDYELVLIHYVDWDTSFDEYFPLTSLYKRVRKPNKQKGFRYVLCKEIPQVHETVFVKWGNDEFYNAKVLKVVRSNACRVHFLAYENEWDQWVVPQQMFTNYTHPTKSIQKMKI